MQLPIPEFVVVEDTKTTSTAAYAAVDTNISVRLAFVKTQMLAAKRTVNMAISPNCVFFWSKRCSKTIAPSRRTAAMTMLTTAATRPT